MMHYLKVAGLILAFWTLMYLLTACSATYSKFGVTREEWARDSFECQYAAQSLPRTPQSIARGTGGVMVYSDPTLGWGDAARSGRMMDLCLRARGYTRE